MGVDVFAKIYLESFAPGVNSLGFVIVRTVVADYVGYYFLWKNFYAFVNIIWIFIYFVFESQESFIFFVVSYVFMNWI